MNKLLVLLLLSLSAQAHVISLVGPCDSTPIIQQELANKFANVGDLTIHFLTKNNIPYVGSQRGLSSVYNTPVGQASLEIISPTEMRSYGWCYFVDGVGPDVYPDELPLTAASQRVDWVFGFAHFKNGVWISQCTPAHKIRPAFLCR